MFFEFLEDVKANKERKKETEEYRKKAQKYVRDGKEIYDKAYAEISSYSSETKYKVEEHYRYKQKIIKEIDSNISPVLSNFETFNIDDKIFDTPSINTPNINVDFSNGLDLFNGISSFIMPTFPIPSILDLFGDVDEEYYEARRQRDEAERYYENMKYEREKLLNIKENMRAIRGFINDEKRLIDSMTIKLKNISKQLISGMQQNKFSVDEAQYFKGLHTIALSINNLISTKFLNDDFTITNQYQSAFNKIQKIDSSLSEIPSLSESPGSINKILEHFILYNK